jgi:hypothetical protein
VFLTGDEAAIALKKTGPSHIDPRRHIITPTRMADTNWSSASVKLHMQVFGADMASRVAGSAQLLGKVISKKTRARASLGVQYIISQPTLLNTHPPLSLCA